jgi:hypothetical protein
MEMITKVAEEFGAFLGGVRNICPNICYNNLIIIPSGVEDPYRTRHSYSFKGFSLFLLSSTL